MASMVGRGRSVFHMKSDHCSSIETNYNTASIPQYRSRNDLKACIYNYIYQNGITETKIHNDFIRKNENNNIFNNLNNSISSCSGTFGNMSDYEQVTINITCDGINYFSCCFYYFLKYYSNKS